MLLEGVRNALPMSQVNRTRADAVACHGCREIEVEERGKLRLVASVVAAYVSVVVPKMAFWGHSTLHSLFYLFPFLWL